MKGFVRPEIYYLLLRGARPKELISAGLNRKTVYSYSARLPDIRMRLIPLEKKLKEMKK